MEIKQFVWDVVDSNSWLMEEDGHGLLIDAVDSQLLYKEILRLTDLTVILTHAHFDHIVGLNKVRELMPNTAVIATENCSAYLGNIYRNMSATAAAFMTFYAGGGKDCREIPPFTCGRADRTFEERMELDWRGHRIRLEAFHGHSVDSLIAVVDDTDMFSGDTLLSIPTVTRFPGGSTKRFWEEDVPRLEAMDVVSVFPGHGQVGGKDGMIQGNYLTRKGRGGNVKPASGDKRME